MSLSQPLHSNLKCLVLCGVLQVVSQANVFFTEGEGGGGEKGGGEKYVW